MSDRRRFGATRLASRFLLYYALTFLVLIGLMGFVVERAMRESLIDGVVDNLEVGARLAAQSLPESPAEYQEWARAVFDATAFRTTLIRSDGQVLADSHSDPDVMEDHSTRPEVLAALRGEVGTSRRVSASTGFEQLYLALPPDGGLIVRESVPIRVIDTELSALRGSILLGVLIVGVLGVVVVALVARRTTDPITELTRQSLQVAGGRLDVSPSRSRVLELDQLGEAISQMARTLGSRLRDAEQATATLETVLRSIPQGTILVAEDDHIAYSNLAAREMFGTIPDDLSALAPWQLQTAVRVARDSRELESRVFDYGKPGRRVRAVATPFGGGSGVLLIAVDITDTEKTDSIRRDFVANASHELKTPVSTIIASSEALQIALSRGDESAMVFAGRIEESARQLSRLVGDLLDLSRLERESPDLSPVRLDLIAQEEVERVRGRSEERQLRLELTTTDVVVHGSQRDLAIAIRNLLDNALRYTGDGGRVRVSVRVEGDMAVIEVSDNGEGIPTRDRERVFERFYRVDSARSRETGGTGLGLSIVKHVAETHDGSVDLESELGVGSTFTLSLPLAEAGERGAAEG